MYPAAKERWMESRDEISFWRASASQYQRALNAALLAKRTAKIAHCEYAILIEIKMFAQDPRDYSSLSALPQYSAPAPVGALSGAHTIDV